MREEHIKAIRSKCIEANPEIVELKFGCVVRVKIGVHINGSGRSDNIRTFTIWAVKDTDIFGVTSDYDPNRIVNQKEIVEIIGRPIRLADVLIMTAHTVEAPVIGDEFVPGLISERFKEYDEKLWQIVKIWEWRKDSLEDQSDETLEFIANLLK